MNVISARHLDTLHHILYFKRSIHVNAWFEIISIRNYQNHEILSILHYASFYRSYPSQIRRPSSMLIHPFYLFASWPRGHRHRIQATDVCNIAGTEVHGVRMGTQSYQLAAGYAAWSIDIVTSPPDGSPVGRVEGGESPH